MVVALGPGKFYGSSLPRPRIYTDVQFSTERVDPPVSVMDPLLSWAHEAHWSMGGLSFHRHRLQGRIEGNVSRLRSQREREFKKKAKSQISSIPSPPDSPDAPAAPLAVKRRRRIIDDDEVEDEDEDEDEDEEEDEVLEKKRSIVRKLKAEFDDVASPEPRKPEKRKRSPVKPIGDVAKEPAKRITRRSPVKAIDDVSREGEKRVTRQSPVKAIDEGGRKPEEVETVRRGGLIGKRLIKGLKGISGSRMFN